TLKDEGVSGFTGDHRKNPDRHALAKFLLAVEKGLVPAGSYLIIENLDRLSREHVRPALMLVLGLIEKGIRIVQLSPNEIIYDTGSGEMSLMLMIVELSRGHRESKVKSERVGKAWENKREKARTADQTLTNRLPGWVEVRGGKRVLIPERAAIVRR